jgi:hypothetical protein
MCELPGIWEPKISKAKIRTANSIAYSSYLQHTAERLRNQWYFCAMREFVSVPGTMILFTLVGIAHEQCA